MLNGSHVLSYWAFLHKSLHAAGSLRVNDRKNMGLYETVIKVVVEVGAISLDGIYITLERNTKPWKNNWFPDSTKDLAVVFLIQCQIKNEF